MDPNDNFEQSLLIGAPALEPTVPDQCFECGSKDIVQNWSEGNVCCRKCGLVLVERLLDVSNEWRNFDDDNSLDRSRIGAPSESMIGSSTATGISKSRHGVSDGGIRSTARKVRRHTETSKERLMAKSIIALDEMGERVNAPAWAKSQSKVIFNAFFDASTIASKGRRTSTFSGNYLKRIEAACVFIALRQAGAGRTYREMGQILGVDFRKLGAVVKNIEMAVPSVKTQSTQGEFDKGPVMRWCKRLGLDRKVGLLSSELAEKLSRTVLDGRSPRTIAGTAIYMCALQNGKDNEQLAGRIAEVANISLHSLMERASEVYMAMPGKIPPNKGGNESSSK